MSLRGKIAIVTGAAPGFGAGIARRWRGEGAEAVVNHAGTAHRNQPMLDVSEERFDRICRVDVVSPVAGETAMLANFTGEDAPQRRAQFIATIPRGRLSQPPDIATAAVFFAPGEASFITGACLEVDGGRCI